MILSDVNRCESARKSRCPRSQGEGVRGWVLAPPHSAKGQWHLWCQECEGESIPSLGCGHPIARGAPATLFSLCFLEFAKLFPVSVSLSSLSFPSWECPLLMSPLLPQPPCLTTPDTPLSITALSLGLVIYRILFVGLRVD